MSARPLLEREREPRLRAMGAEARGRMLDGAAALAATVVLPETAPPAGGGSSYGTLHGLYWLVVGLAAERPQLLVVDDAHWADEASLRFLLFLANRLDDSPVLLLVAQRPEGDALRAAPGLTAVAPRALSPEATATALAGGAAGIGALREAAGQLERLAGPHRARPRPRRARRRAAPRRAARGRP